MSDAPPRKALFAGLIRDEFDNPVEVAMVADVPNYVIDDAGFYRHVEAEKVDRQVIDLLHEQFMEHREIATDANQTILVRQIGGGEVFGRWKCGHGNMDWQDMQGIFSVYTYDIAPDRPKPASPRNTRVSVPLTH